MKKEKDSAIVNLINRIINVRAWFDFARVKAGTLYLINGIKKMFVPQKTMPAETFEEVVTKLKLTNADLEIKQRALWRLSLLMVVIASVVFIYACYNFIFGHFAAGALSMIVTSIALVLGFRYNFWYYQIKQRKLGCTFSEWYKDLRGKRS